MIRKEYTQKDFAWVKWASKDIKKFLKVSPIQIKKNLEKIKKIKKEDRTFANTMLAYERAEMREGEDMHKIGLLSAVSPEKSVREAAREAEVTYANFLTSLVYDESLYTMFKEYYDHNYQTEKEKLEPEDIKLVEDTYKAFKRIGFDLPKPARKKMQKIDEKVNALASKYDAALAEDSSHILCTEKQLEGLPQNIIDSLTRVGDKYKVSISYPEWGPYMQYANDRAKRREMHIKFSNSGGQKNVKIIDELIRLRMEKAKILGYTHHGDYMTESRMAKNAANVYAMQDDLLDKLESVAKSDIKIITDFAKKDLSAQAGKISKVESWDTVYYADKISKEKYSVDNEELRQYFPIDHVQNEMFTLFGDLFGFEVIETKIKVWHKEVVTYKVIDSKSNGVLGYISCDLFPREGKFGHACMVDVAYGYELEKGYNTPYAVIICNFSRAMTTRKKRLPSLLTVREVQTLFHEFGHALHHIMTSARHASQSGTAVAWDFVETPSQLLEEWISDEKVLTKISKHWETGKSLPKDEIAKLKAMEKFNNGIMYTRQLVQGKLDMDLYTGNAKDAVRHFHDLMKKYLLPQDKEVLFVSRFAHIARGYDAGYYSYIWAERIVKNIFAKFKEKDEKGNSRLFDKKLGAKYRKEILERGSSRDENESAEAFLGHEIRNDVFVKEVMG